MHLAWLLISATAAAPPATIGTCTNDQDCVIYSKQYPSSRSGYACVQNTCKTLLIPGARCISSDACSLHHFLLKQFNSTAPDVCEPRFCSLSTLCVNDGAADSDSVSGCCGGALQNEVCQIVAVDVCSQGSSCSPNDDNTFRCKIETKQSTQWIGVLITLVAAAVSNLGLNLQKLALRKRFEKRVVRDRNDHDTLQKRLAEMKSEFANMYHNASFVSLTMPFQRQRSQSPENPEAQNAQKKDEEEQMNSRDSNDSVIEPQPKQSPSFRRDRTQITQNTDITQASNTESRLSPPHQPMSPEFQTELHMAGLFKNPVYSSNLAMDAWIHCLFSWKYPQCCRTAVCCPKFSSPSGLDIISC